LFLFLKGTTAEQDNRFSDKQKKLLKTLQFPPEFAQKVDMKKVNLDTIKSWITERINTILESEDEILENFVFNQLECETPDPRHMQINLTGFLNAKKAREFMTELWTMLVSAQEAPDGVPPVLVEQRMRMERELMKLEAEKVKREAAVAPKRSPVRSPSVPKRVRSPLESAEHSRYSWNQEKDRDGGRNDLGRRESEWGKGTQKRWKHERSRSRADEIRRGRDWCHERYGASESRNWRRSNDRRRKYHRDTSAHKDYSRSRRGQTRDDQEHASSSPKKRFVEERKLELHLSCSSEKAAIPPPRTPSSDAEEPESSGRSENNRKREVSPTVVDNRCTERSYPTDSIDQRRKEEYELASLVITDQFLRYFFRNQTDSLTRGDNEMTTKGGGSPNRSGSEGPLGSSTVGDNGKNQLLRADEPVRHKSDQQKRYCRPKYRRSRSRRHSHSSHRKRTEDSKRHHQSQQRNRLSKSPNRSQHSNHRRHRSNRDKRDERTHHGDFSPSSVGESRSKRQNTESRRKINASYERCQNEENKDSLPAGGRHDTLDGRRHRQHSRSPRRTLDSTRDRRRTSNRNEGASLVEYGSNDSLDGLEEKSRDLAESGKSGKEGNRHAHKRGFDKDECMKYMSKKQMKELRAQYLSTDTSEVSDGDLVQNFPISYSSEGSSEDKDLVDQKTVTDNENLEFVLPRSYQKHQAVVEKGSKVEKEKGRPNSPIAESRKRCDDEKVCQQEGTRSKRSCSAERLSKKGGRSLYSSGDNMGSSNLTNRKRKRSHEKRPKDKRRKKHKKSSKSKHEKRVREQSMSDNGGGNSESEKLRSIALKSLRNRNK
ncbi:hypothetical protein M513_06222, partial [Trichuris suis]